MIGKILLHIGILGRIRAKQGVNKQVLFTSKIARGFGVVAAVEPCNPMKICNFYPHLSLGSVSSTHLYYAASKTILKICKMQNMKPRELQNPNFQAV